MPERILTTTSRSAQATEEIAAQLAQSLRPGDAVLIAGELGAGKTTFVRGAARALGVTTPVTSPTFTIGHIYETDPAAQAASGSQSDPCVETVSHLDLYRLSSLAGEDPDLLADYVGSDTVAFVEWPASGEHELAGLANVVYRVLLEHGGGDLRAVTIIDQRQATDAA